MKAIATQTLIFLILVAVFITLSIPSLIKEIKINGTTTTTIPDNTNIRYCLYDSECIVALNMYDNGCEHVCQDKECVGASICTVINKNYIKDWRQMRCVWNQPCNIPDSIRCVDNLCRGLLTTTTTTTKVYECETIEIAKKVIGVILPKIV